MSPGGRRTEALEANRLRRRSRGHICQAGKKTHRDSAAPLPKSLRKLGREEEKVVLVEWKTEFELQQQEPPFRYVRVHKVVSA